MRGCPRLDDDHGGLLGERKFLTGLRRPASSMRRTRPADRHRSENSVEFWDSWKRVEFLTQIEASPKLSLPNSDLAASELRVDPHPGDGHRTAVAIAAGVPTNWKSGEIQIDLFFTTFPNICHL